MARHLFNEVDFVRVLPLLILVAHLILFFWLRKKSPGTKAVAQPGRMIFPPLGEIRAAFFVTALLVAFFLVWCSISLEPGEWWLPYVFVGLLMALPFLYPRILIIEVHGVVSRTWLGREKTIRWEDVAELHYAMDNRAFTVRDKENRKIVHRVFHAEPLLFRNLVRERTRLPLKITHHGGLKNKTIELPYRDQP